jgi:hypothetical protein
MAPVQPLFLGHRFTMTALKSTTKGTCHMKIATVGSAIAILLATTALGSAGAAAAEPTTGSAADVVKALQDQGYNVQFNMPSTMVLSRCTVNGVRGLTVMMSDSGNLMVMMAPTNPNSTVYVDLSCPSSNN